ncbi:hypothetical protein [Kribbella sindirgiensis]|uniref:Uncharacterized protein n=1 Tax=Kribbella sindirgiensis TaxID=1124744 RepID=A0A4R0IDR0_9ACTN|nr:hypothetical protein [Kribbella sindirgiensis]TCC31321.1 hypothetical protein E0H50_21825 [Kribbella sindirgiensis]
MRRRSGGREMVSVAGLLLVVVTGLGLIMMPRVVGADWPGWTSMMFLVAVLVIPTVWVLIGISTGTASVAQWIAVLGVGAVLVRVAWSTYDAGPALLLAVLPLLTVVVVLTAVLAYSWPRATTREVRDCAHRNGWRIVDPRELRLPSLPLPVGRTWSARNVVQTPDGLAFEVRWLQWSGLLCRRRRLSVFVATLPVELPAMAVRPGGLTRSDLTLESAEFNRSFDVIGDEPRYLMAVLHPRTMQALLDARPVRLAIEGTALVLSRDEPLTAESLTQGLRSLAGIRVPQHVYDDWGQRAAEPGRGLRFRGRRFDPSPGAALLRMTTLATGLLGLTLLCCLAAAATEADFDPPHSVGRLLIAGALLLAIAAAGALSRRVHGSISA